MFWLCLSDGIAKCSGSQDAKCGSMCRAVIGNARSIWMKKVDILKSNEKFSCFEAVKMSCSWNTFVKMVVLFISMGIFMQTIIIFLIFCDNASREIIASNCNHGGNIQWKQYITHCVMEFRLIKMFPEFSFDSIKINAHENHSKCDRFSDENRHKSQSFSKITVIKVNFKVFKRSLWESV